MKQRCEKEDSLGSTYLSNTGLTLSWYLNFGRFAKNLRG